MNQANHKYTLQRLADQRFDGPESSTFITSLHRLGCGTDLDSLIKRSYLETWMVVDYLDENLNLYQYEKDALNWLWGYIDGQTTNVVDCEKVFP